LTSEADDRLMMMLYCLLGSSPFLRKVDDILTTELKHLPARYSLTALLNTWVRACVCASQSTCRRLCSIIDTACVVHCVQKTSTVLFAE